MLVSVLSMTVLIREASLANGRSVLGASADVVAEKAHSRVEEGRLLAGAAADALAGLYQSGELDRNTYAEVMRQFVKNSSGIEGAGLVFEVDAIGKDADNIGRNFSNNDGRLAAYFVNDNQVVTWHTMSLEEENGYRHWYEGPKVLSRGAVSGPFVTALDGTENLTIIATAPMLTDVGAFIGAVMIKFPLRLRDVFTQKPFSSASSSIITDRSTRFNDPSSDVENEGLPSAVLSELSKPDSNGQWYFSSNGLGTAVRTLGFVGLDQKWHVTTAVDENEFLAPARDALWLALVLTIGLLPFAIVATWALVVKQVRPIDLLTIRISQLSEGDNQAPVPHLKRTDELGRLARSIDALRLRRSVKNRGTDV